VEKDDEVAGPPVQDPVQLPPEVAPQLAELPLDLGAVRERHVRVGWGKHVETVDLVVERYLALDREPVDEVVDWLCAIGRPIVDGLEVRHEGTIPRATDNLGGREWQSVDPVSEGGFEPPPGASRTRPST
jgi:hypothetical protein